LQLGLAKEIRKGHRGEKKENGRGRLQKKKKHQEWIIRWQGEKKLEGSSSIIRGKRD